MQLLDVSLRAGSETWLHPLSLTLSTGEINVVLGATRAGKTTLLRIFAGLEQPTTGRVLVGEHDVTRVPVRQRKVAMVYQQFINYPSLSVFENIASPLRVAGVSSSDIRLRVAALAEMLHLSPVLSRSPGELSGGQQQRVALARALAKDAQLVLLDEPLVNLDYKLREELRGELTQIFAERHTTAMYATTEPQEALQLGGHLHLLDAGQLLQSGPTIEVFRHPATLAAARAFSDPPLNLLPARIDAAEGVAHLTDGLRLPLPRTLLQRLRASGHEITLALRPHQLRLESRGAGYCSIRAEVKLAEISGSETYVHVSAARTSLTAQLPGVHRLALGELVDLYFHPSDLCCFNVQGQLLDQVEC